MSLTGPRPPRETLTSRERVKRAIRHQPVDRMPIDLGVHYSTGISAMAYWNLRRHLGLDTDRIEVCDVIQFLARVDEDVLRRFHCDCLLLHPGWPATRRWCPRAPFEFTVPALVNPQRQDDGAWAVERNGQRMTMPAGGFFFDGGWPGFDDRPAETVLEATALEAERIDKETDYATMYIGFGAYFSDHPDWLCKMLTDPDELLAANQAACDRDIAWAGKVLKRMGRHIQVVCTNSDLGSQNGPFCRPSVYEQISAPFLKRFCAFIHENSDCKVFLHCCGSIKPMLPILIDCGVDIINPVQISARDMDPRELKASFGDRLVFWGGGCDTQNVLGRGTPEAVAANVRSTVSAFKPGSGFVFNQVHNIMGNVPPENIVAMLDTAYEVSAS